jgi:hypothetical protein
MDRSELEALSTEELRAKAFSVAEHRLDVGFFWDLLKHLPASGDVAGDDSFSGPSATISDLVELFRELRGDHQGETEPLFRAKYLDYLTAHA